MQSIEIQAKTVEEAISIACEKLNAPQDKLNIEILSTGPGKLMSLFSAKKAKIRASLNGHTSSAQEDGIEQLREILETIVQNIDQNATVQMKPDQEETIYEILGDGSGIFIGKHGQTLEALQFLMNKIRLNRYRSCPHIVVDSESYRSRHVESLLSLAERLSAKAKKRRGPVTTNPLSPGDRRIIHMALKKDSELTTWSKGDGNLKKVIIAPKQS